MISFSKIATHNKKISHGKVAFAYSRTVICTVKYLCHCEDNLASERESTSSKPEKMRIWKVIWFLRCVPVHSYSCSCIFVSQRTLEL